MLVVRYAGSQQVPAAVCDHSGVWCTFEKVLWQAEYPACHKDPYNNYYDFPADGHRMTVAEPEAVLAATCGSYIAEHVMAGSV